MLANSIIPIAAFHGDLSDPSVLRLVFAIPFVLAWLGVGHWVTVTALGRVSSKFEIAVLTAASAIAVVILQGLFLNAIGCLSTSGWVVSTALIGVVVFAKFHLSDAGVSWPRPPRIDRRQAGAFAASILFVAVAVMVARAGVDQHRQFKFTEFWLLPAATNQQFILGVTNHEQKDVTYSIEITADNRLVETWKNIHIADGETWTSPWSNPAAWNAQSIEAILFPAEDKTIGTRRVQFDRRAWSPQSPTTVTREQP